jgi:hypothetical protein
MPLQDVQVALFKLYLNPGYRLAYRVDPEAFCEAAGLTGQDAKFLAGLAYEEIDAFARSLGFKRLAFLERAVPVSCAWISAQRPELLTGFLDTHTPRKSERPETQVREFVSFIEESVLFHDDLPPALPEVARFECMVAAAREQSSPEPVSGRRQDEACAARDDAVYWCPPTTRTGTFSVDVLSIASRSADMQSAGDGFSAIVAPGKSARRPIVLRVAEPVVRLVEQVRTPLRRSDLALACEGGGDSGGGGAGMSGAGMSSAVVAQSLAQLDVAGVISHVCADCPVR